MPRCLPCPLPPWGANGSGEARLSPLCSLLGGFALQTLLLHRHPAGENGCGAVLSEPLRRHRTLESCKGSWAPWFGMRKTSQNLG